jgi:SAM-dependent methyltransferase
MLRLFRRKPKSSTSPPRVADPGEGPSECRTLTKLEGVLARRVERGETPAVLLAGQPSGKSIEAFTKLGCRVTVEGDGEDRVPIEAPAHAFDLILGFDVLDLLDADHAPPLVAEWQRVLREKGQVFLLTRAEHARWPRDLRFDVREGGRMRIVEGGSTRAGLQVRTVRALEKLLAPLEVIEIQLRRDGLREVLAQKRP